MKRVLSLAASLAVALAILWYCAARGARPEPAALLSQVQAGDTAAPELSVPASNWLERRESLASAPAPTVAFEPRSIPADFTGPPAPQAARRSSATVYVELRFAGTHAPVSTAFVLLFLGESSSSIRSELDERGDGLFGVELPVGTRLASIDVCARATSLVGPQSETKAAGRFRSFHAELDRILGESDLEFPFEVDGTHDATGIVRDAISQAPVARAEVTLRLPSGEDVRLCSGPDGRFGFGNPGGTLRLRTEHPGYLPSNRELAGSDLAPGAPPLVVLLDRGLRVSGCVVDARGSPQPHVELELEMLGDAIADPNHSGHRRFTSRSRDDGSFSFTELPHCAFASIGTSPTGPDADMYLGSRRELGVLREDAEDLVLVNPDSTLIEVFTQLADGTPLGPWGIQLSCPEPHLLKYGILVADGYSARATLGGKPLVPRQVTNFGQQVLIPLGVELHLLAIACPDPQAPNRVAIGRRTLVIERAEARPIEVRIVLDQPLDYVPPPTPEGASEIQLDLQAPRATVDLHLLDAQEQPLPKDSRVTLEGSGQRAVAILADGWVRLLGAPGQQRLHVAVGDLESVFELEFPTSGFARVEQRLARSP